MIKYISFDLDGTISNENFDKMLWNEEMPKLYAETHSVHLDEAKKHIYAEFYKALFIEKIDNFTDVDYWFKRHGLDDWEALLKQVHPHFFIYDDAQRLLDHLKGSYKLALLTSSERKLLEIKFTANDLKDCFTHIFSTPSDFSISMKNREAFEKMLKELNVSKEEIVHIGDSKHMDFDVPKSIGIKAYLIDRTKERSGDGIIHSLDELIGIL